MLDKAIRELDRERMGLQNQEKKLVAEIKKMAKQGQMVCLCGADLILLLLRWATSLCGARLVHAQSRSLHPSTWLQPGSQALVLLQDAVKVMAKSLVRNRHAVTKMYGLKSQLQAVSLRMATLKSTQAMADAMRGATKVSNQGLGLVLISGVQGLWLCPIITCVVVTECMQLEVQGGCSQACCMSQQPPWACVPAC